MTVKLLMAVTKMVWPIVNRVRPRLHSIAIQKRCCSSQDIHDSPLPPNNSNFPSFTTIGQHSSDFKTFCKSPNLNVVASMILNGYPNTPFKDFNQESSDRLIEGSLFAVEAVTKTLAQEDNIDSMSEQLTTECLEKLTKIIATDPRLTNEVNNAKRLIATPKDDVFFAWIDKAEIHKDTGQLKMRVCSLSYPGFQIMVDQMQTNKARQVAFKEDIQRQIVNGLDRDGFKDKLKEFEGSLFDVSTHFGSTCVIVASNWDFIQVGA
jgi:hypothetical protein